MGWGVTLTRVVVGARPITSPFELTGKTTCDMNTFHSWPAATLGSPFLSDPYQTASARPGPPALIHGKTLTASPLVRVPPLTCTGLAQSRQPLPALAALTNT